VNLGWGDGLILGLVQGLTEFLPISSSGHLVLAERLLRFESRGVFVEVMVHVATLVSVVIAYRIRIGALLRGLFGRGRDAWRYAGLLLLASVPAAVSGMMFKDFFERTFHSLPALGWNFLITAGLLWSTRWAPARRQDGTTAPGSGGSPDPEPSSRPAVMPSIPQALVIGCAQAVAILPAISRSGSTIAAGLWTGLPAVVAAEFSFLMSIIVIAGSGILEARHLVGGSQVVTAGLATAFVTAMVAGLAAIYFLVALLRRGKFHYFAPYCAALGLLCLAWFAF
jgi:undecaprenyl-diphosphatase